MPVLSSARSTISNSIFIGSTLVFLRNGRRPASRIEWPGLAVILQARVGDKKLAEAQHQHLFYPDSPDLLLSPRHTALPRTSERSSTSGAFDPAYFRICRLGLRRHKRQTSPCACEEECPRPTKVQLPIRCRSANEYGMQACEYSQRILLSRVAAASVRYYSQELL